MRSPRDRSMDSLQPAAQQRLARTVLLAWLCRWSAREVATVLGYSPSTVCRWQRGDCLPTVRAAQDMCERADEYRERLQHNAAVTNRSKR